MPPFSIAPFTLGDLKAILGLEQVCFPEDTYDMIEFLSLYLRGKDTFFIARQDKMVIGYAVGYVENKHGYVVSIAVDPEVRGRGLGRRLMERLMAALEEMGARVIRLHVRDDNQHAIRLYQSLGFTARDTVPNYYHDGAPALVMQR
ncbi:MAG: ribosomal protein S18-alanine N-acetyltransferase [Anaerolineae bacterium]|nr:ribosomal protein S18-alanine N-acetyltransferase [Anaerolineae bacterium]